MLFILIDEERKKNCIDFISKANTQKGEKICVEIKAYRKNRSAAQNSTYWMWLSQLAEFSGEDKDRLHEQLSIKFLGTEQIIAPRYLLGVDTGEVRIAERVKSTTTLDTKEMAEYLSKIEMVARNADIKLKYPDDYKYAMEGKKTWK